ncbi:hypothetical protein NL676_000551 [Syzygium grande]|nr:hypothetical protein NL676_000551 [Syzygium grande]
MARGRMNLVQTCAKDKERGKTLNQRGISDGGMASLRLELSSKGSSFIRQGVWGGGDGRRAVTAATPQGAAPRPNPRRSNPPKHVHGEQVAAGWPSWLSEVVGEAINGWTPRRADTFEKLDKEYMVVCSISEQK